MNRLPKEGGKNDLLTFLLALVLSCATAPRFAHSFPSGNGATTAHHCRLLGWKRKNLTNHHHRPQALPCAVNTQGIEPIQKDGRQQVVMRRSSCLHCIGSGSTSGASRSLRCRHCSQGARLTFCQSECEEAPQMRSACWHCNDPLSQTR